MKQIDPRYYELAVDVLVDHSDLNCAVNYRRLAIEIQETIDNWIKQEKGEEE